MLHANILSHEGYEGADLVRAQEALGLLENVINGGPFQRAVLAFDAFQFDVFEAAPAGYIREHRPARTNREVLDTLLNGMRSAGTDTYMDLHLRLVPGRHGHVVGEELHGVITTFREDFEALSPGERAGHYLHECAHALGFHHSKSHEGDPGRNCYSVPYALGNLMVYLTTGRMPFKCDYPFLTALGA
ncbi:MAG: hypothetical protein QM724_07805 [Flavobacteriales bacterium]